MQTIILHSDINRSVHFEMWHDHSGETFKFFSYFFQLYLLKSKGEYFWYEGVESLYADPGMQDSLLVQSGKIDHLVNNELDMLLDKAWGTTAPAVIKNIIKEHYHTSDS